jgi:hypothetical protein
MSFEDENMTDHIDILSDYSNIILIMSLLTLSCQWLPREYIFIVNSFNNTIYSTPS